uniref:YfcC family protein n=2 Tax=Roseivirga sp. TaxID=1964215 RepID=UPI00404842B9
MKSFKFPSPFTVLYIIIIISAAATYLLPSGNYATLSYDTEEQELVFYSESGVARLDAQQSTLDSLGLKMDISKFTEGKIQRPVSVPGTFTETDPNPQGINAVIMAPIKGIYESIDIILFVLLIGGFIGVFITSGVFDQGVTLLSERLEGREKWLIIAVITLIALGGTTFGMQEETLALYPILVPIFLAAGYDLIVPVASLYCGSCVGYMGAIINPFGTILASDAAGVNWTVGMYSRISMLGVGAIIAMVYIVRYAEKVKRDPSKSMLYGLNLKVPFPSVKRSDEPSKLSAKAALLLIIFSATFLIMVYGVIALEWWFGEMTALFLVAALVLGLIIRKGETTFIESFINGAKDMLGVAFIVGMARGITIVMNDGQISGTLLNFASEAVSGVSGLIFLPCMMLVFFVLAFFIPSTSGLALLSMPIMGALANIVGVPSEEIVNAYLFGFGLMNLIAPTGVLLPSLTMVNVPYNVWLKFVGPLVLMLGAVGIAILIMGYLV